MFAALVQGMPQPPQFETLLWVSTQLALHAVNGAGQVGVQVPLVQNWPAVQALVQLPQCAGSAWVSKHALVHSDVAPPQVATQVPAVQR